MDARDFVSREGNFSPPLSEQIPAGRDSFAKTT
jgi:hypothetical protein